MNFRMIQRASGKLVKIRPIAHRVEMDGQILPDIDDDWSIRVVSERSSRKVEILNCRTHHIVSLGSDNIQEFRSPNFLLLKSQLLLSGREVRIEPLPDSRSAGRRPPANIAGLKRKALALAVKISAFTERRMSEFSVLGQEWPHVNGFQDGRRVGLQFPFNNYDRETCRIYWESFRESVATLRDRLAAEGFRNDDLDRSYRELPQTNASIYAVINGFRAIAEAMAQK